MADDENEMDFGDEGGGDVSGDISSSENPPIAVMFVALLALVLCAVFGLRVYTFSSPIFLLNQQAVNTCFLIVMSFFYGMVTYRMPENSPFRAYQTLFLPVLLIVAVWLKSYVIYSSNLYVYCSAADNTTDAIPFRWRALIWNSAKPCIAILATFLFVTLFPWTLTPFFELFGSAHPLVYFIGVGFWTGCATWGAEASSFFELQRTGCRPATKIQFADVTAGTNPLDPEVVST